jgi:hypothetical protein
MVTSLVGCFPTKSYENKRTAGPRSTSLRAGSPLRSVDEWVAQVSLLRPGFSLQWAENPGLKSETWATHSMFVRASLIFFKGAEGP